MQGVVAQILPGCLSVSSYRTPPHVPPIDIWKQRIVSLVNIALRRIETVRRVFHYPNRTT